MSIHDQLIVYKYDNETIMELPRNIVADSHKKLLLVANEMKEQTYRYRVGGYGMNIREVKEKLEMQREIIRANLKSDAIQSIDWPLPKKTKKCTHEHVSRGVCLYCGEGVV